MERIWNEREHDRTEGEIEVITRRPGHSASWPLVAIHTLSRIDLRLQSGTDRKGEGLD